MKLYHGSRKKLDKLVPQQAGAAEGLNVPDGELLDAIYLTPDLGFAIACAVRPEGVTHINTDQTIEFENSELFNPEEEIYIYEIDSEKIPKENIREVDDQQIAVVDIDELIPEATQELKAADVEKYYEIREFREQADSETDDEFSAGELGRNSRK